MVGVATGAVIDPLPFINPIIKVPEQVLMAAEKLKGWFRPGKDQNISVYNSQFIVRANTLLNPVAVSAKSYRMELPNGMLIQIRTQSNEKTIAPNQQKH